MELPANHRNAKWWYSTFHNVTAMVGTGVLTLPYAMSELGWGPGVTIMLLSWIITLYTLWQMVEMHEMVPGKRFDRYHELGQHAFGKKLGLWIVVPQQLIVEIGVDIVYMVTGGQSLKKMHDLYWPEDDLKLTYWIMIFASVHLVLAQAPNLNKLSWLSLVAAVMSLSYSVIAWGASLHKGVVPDVSYALKASTTQGQVFDFFGALGDVAFAYAGHNVVLEIQSTIPSTPEKPSKKPMWKGVVFAYIVAAICYFPVAFIGYYMFGNTLTGNILIALNKPRWLIALANCFVFFHVLGSYQIFAMPVFDMMENFLVGKMKFTPGLPLRLVGRSLYVLLTMFVAITFPFFGGLLGFFGGFVFAPTTYFMEDWFINQEVHDEDKVFVIEQHLSKRVYEKFNEMQWRLIDQGKKFVDDWTTLKNIFRYVFLPLDEIFSYVETKIESSRQFSNVISVTVFDGIEEEVLDKKNKSFSMTEEKEEQSELSSFSLKRSVQSSLDLIKPYSSLVYKQHEDERGKIVQVKKFKVDFSIKYYVVFVVFFIKLKDDGRCCNLLEVSFLHLFLQDSLHYEIEASDFVQVGVLRPQCTVRSKWELRIALLSLT